MGEFGGVWSYLSVFNDVINLGRCKLNRSHLLNKPILLLDHLLQRHDLVLERRHQIVLAEIRVLGYFLGYPGVGLRPVSLLLVLIHDLHQRCVLLR